MVGKKLKLCSNHIINIIIIILFSISVLGALSGIVNDFLQLSSEGIYLFDVLIILFAVLCYLFKKFHFFKLVSKMDKDNYNLVKILSILMLISWQLWVVISLNGQPLYDSNTVLNKAMFVPGNEDYFSTYPNNFLILMIEKNIWLVFNSPNTRNFTLILSILNVVLVDSSIFLVSAITKKVFSRRISCIYVFLSSVFIGLSPWLSVPYTDIWSFFLSSLSIYLCLKAFYTKSKKRKILLSFLIGIVMSFSYFMKPSLIIFYIAVAIVAFLVVPIKNKQIRLIDIIVVLVSAFLFSTVVLVQKNNNDLIHFDSDRAFSMMHFAAMGATKNGGYNPQDFAADKAIQDPKKRTKRDITVLKQRLTSFRTIANYQRFLTKKHILNTADGTFAWGYDGGTKEPFKIKKHNLPQKLFFKNGEASKKSIFSFPIQILWTLSLLAVFFTIPGKK